MSWHRRRLAAFDLETTGIDSESDRIVTAAVSLVGDGRESVFHAWLVDPGIEIPAGAAAVHGITTERARAEGRQPAEAIAEIVMLLADQLRQGVPIVAFNARFDLTCLDREARRHGIPTLIERVGAAGMLVVDPYVLDKQADRYRKGKRTLGDVCRHYNVPLDEAHASHADALAAARVAWRLGEAFEELRAPELPALHTLQIDWAAEQAASFEDYLRRNGRDERIERVWPIVPLPDEQPEQPVPLAA
ncbi:MAG TPA: exonuclease domain-containing protein [Conexibacter sp.]|nr:exonuclease domain-containing protein [Conexibacter sp.]